VVVDASSKTNETTAHDEALILQTLGRANKPALLVINKIDQIQKPLLLPLLDAYRQKFPFVELMPLSAKTGEGADVLMEALFSHLPEGDPMFDEDMLTDQAERVLVAEWIREQIFHHCQQEVPYSTAVVVDGFDESEREEPPLGGKGGSKPTGLVRIDASIYVERESQKAIVIGKRGQMLKAIGTAARMGIERLLGARVYLALQVKVEPGWTQRSSSLKKLGYP
jgi:GTP-binding protein Era